MANQKSSFGIERLGPIPLLFAGSLLISIFFIGMGLPESLRIARTGSEISQILSVFQFGSSDSGILSHVWEKWTELRSGIGILEIARALPVGLIYYIGGVSDSTSLVIPLIATLVNATLLYAIASRVYGKGAGLIAAFLWLALPATILSASTLLYSQITISLFLAGVLLLIRWLKEPTDKVSVLFIAPALVGLLILDFVAGLCLFALIAALGVTKWPNQLMPRIPFLMLATFLLIVSRFDLGDVFVAFYTDLVRLPEMEVLLLTSLIFLTVTIEKADKKNDLVRILSGIAFIGVLIQIATTPSDILAARPMFVILLGSISMMGGAYLASFFKKADVFKVVGALSIIVVVTSWLAARGQNLLIGNLDGAILVSASTLMPVLQVLPGILLVALVVSLYQESRNAKQPLVGGLVLLLLVLCLIPHSWQQKQHYQPVFAATREAGELLSTADLALPIYILNDMRLTDHLEYLDLDIGPIRVIEKDQIEAIQSGYLLYWEGQTTLQENWWQMGVLGRLGLPRLRVNRILSQADAAAHLEAMKSRVEREAISQNYIALYGAEINSGAVCEAYTLWVNSQVSGPTGPPYIEVDGDMVRSCFEINSPPLVTISSLGYDSAYPSYVRIEKETEEGIVNSILSVSKKYTFFEDPRIFDLVLVLEPNTFYLYEATLRSPDPIVSLYFRLEDTENHLDYTSYIDWTTVAILFSTNGYLEATVRATFSPVLFYQNGAPTYIQRFQITEIDVK